MNLIPCFIFRCLCCVTVEACSILKIPTFATEQYPKGLGSTVAEIKLKVN